MRKHKVLIAVFLVVLVIICLSLYLTTEYIDDLPIYKTHRYNDLLYKQLVHKLYENEHKTPTQFLTDIFGDQIYCINLKSRPDRYNLFVIEFESNRINPDIVTFHQPDKDRRGGAYGCWESHRCCLTNFFNSNSPYALICEDDLHLAEEWKLNITQILPFIEHDETWDIVNLHRMGTTTQNMPFVFKGYGLCTVSYIVSRRYVNKFVDCKGKFCYPEATGEHIDVATFVDNKSSVFTDEVYFVYQPAVQFTDSPNDNEKAAGIGRLMDLLGFSSSVLIYKNAMDLLSKVHTSLPRMLIVEFGKQEVKQRQQKLSVAQ
jgi:GR25 family glycosyltransferase involved in LPS biosynthesis